MKKLNWKTKTFSDLSGSWMEAHVPVLDWTYSVEEAYATDGTYEAYVLPGPGAEPKKLHSGTKSLEKAKSVCAQHLTKSLEKLQAYLPPSR